MKEEPRLTIGMACHNDFQGVYFTLQALRLYHSEVLSQCEVLVVDNDPGTREGKWTKDLVVNWLGPHAGTGPGQPARVTYLPAPEVEGTSAPRNLVFSEATCEHVLCLDCHVLLYPGALASLLAYYKANPDTNDLLSGPIVMDNLTTIHTHLDNVWRGEMWGIWASAWECPCPAEFRFCPREVAIHIGSSVSYYPLMGGLVVNECPRCARPLPGGSWYGHERPLRVLGFRSLASIAKPCTSTSPDTPSNDGCGAPPFEIPAMGLGLFSSRKDAWQRFNPTFRGFGGEEFYIHEKFRRAGARCLCLPDLKWVHRFARQGQEVPYRLTMWDKVRNHVIGAQELGLPLDRVYREFVLTGKVPQHEWDQVVAGAEWPAGQPRLPRR